MNKREWFQNTLKKKRKYLIQQGILPSTVTLWAKGLRIPRHAQAEKLSILLNIPIEKIPHRECIIK
jgi:hypothetical protein